MVILENNAHEGYIIEQELFIVASEDLLISILEQKCDVVFDAVGKTSKVKARKILKKEGCYGLVKALARTAQKHLKELCKLAKEGKISPFIVIIFPLADIVEAHEYVEKGHKSGNLVISLDNTI